MRDSSDCPGRFKCHGPASWCDVCGDVDLICDDPRCEMHMHQRFTERQAARDKAYAEYLDACARWREANKAYEDAKEHLERYTTGNPVMVARRV